MGSGQIALPPNGRRTRLPRLEDAVEVGAGRESTFGGDDIIAVIGVGNHHFLGRSEADVAQPYPERSLQRLVEVYREFVFRDMDRMGEGEEVHPPILIAHRRAPFVQPLLDLLSSILRHQRGSLRLLRLVGCMGRVGMRCAIRRCVIRGCASMRRIGTRRVGRRRVGRSCASMSPIAWSRLARRNDTRRSDIRSRDGLLRYRLLLLSDYDSRADLSLRLFVEQRLLRDRKSVV